VFGLNNKKAGGINVLILVSSLGFDMSNHTVVVDAAVWPLALALIGPIGKCLYHLNDTWNSRVPGHVILIVLYARWDC
jgi:hypothetical protein